MTEILGIRRVFVSTLSAPANALVGVAPSRALLGLAAGSADVFLTVGGRTPTAADHDFLLAAGETGLMLPFAETVPVRATSAGALRVWEGAY